MAITVNIYYKGKDDNAQRFAQEIKVLWGKFPLAFWLSKSEL